MKKISIEIVEDESHPEGGHAIIRLKGLKSRPDNDAFMIEPADQSLGAKDLKGWPSGARTPLNARMTAAGFEIVAGPDVVESPVLLPGTPVVVKVPGAAVSTEVLWPSITPLRRQKIKRIITSNDRRDAIARAKADAEAAAVLANGAGTGGKGGLSELDARKSAEKEAAGAAGTASMFGTAASAAQAAAAAAAASMPKSAGSLAGTGAGGPGVAAAGNEPISESDAVKVDEPKVTISTPLDQLTEDKLRSRQMVHVGPIEPQIRKREQGTRRYATLALTVALLAAATSVLSHFTRFGWPGSGGAAPASTAAPVLQVAAKPPASLYDAFSVDAISPKGIDASNVDPAAAIRQADENLYGIAGKRDAKEGAFWLKQYMGKRFGNQQTLWALTQLGSTFAQPADAKPDYDKARLLWETASALGDPVASCFLGNLHEYGLGVSPSKFEALKWYLRAKETGGCRSVDQAIKRVRE